MSGRSRGFDRLATGYRLMEFVAFGADLERARFVHLEHLKAAREILLLGEGDGRCAERVARIAPGARLLCVDSSPGMIRRARRRLAGTGAEGRVELLCCDALSFVPEPGRFDAVATLFFLDCFGPEDADRIVCKTSAALKPGAAWLFADFVLPQRGLARLRARAWLALLYAFFRWETGLGVSKLPPSETLLASQGWIPAVSQTFQGGLIRSSLLRRPSGSTAAQGASA